MTTLTELASAPSGPLALFIDRLRWLLTWLVSRAPPARTPNPTCAVTAEQHLDPIAAQRPHLELYIRWMQEIRQFKPFTISRRFSVKAGFYRISVFDGVLEHSPAEYVRRPSAPAESPTLGFTHLQFEALLTAIRQSPAPCDFALVAMLGRSACGSSRPPAPVAMPGVPGNRGQAADVLTGPGRWRGKFPGYRRPCTAIRAGLVL